MTEYRVTWEIDVSADSPEDAARLALGIQRDDRSSAVVFSVRSESGRTVTIDLEDLT